MFLSKGTLGSKVGGSSGDSDSTVALKANIIGSNGGNGIEEVHALASKGQFIVSEPHYEERHGRHRAL